MTAPTPSQNRQAQGATGLNIPTVGETVVCTLAGISTQGPGAVVNLEGWVELLLGTGTNGVTLRIRRGVDATGVVVGTATTETGGIAAGSTTGFNIQEQDTPGEVAGQSYVLTLQQANATANGTVAQSSLQATISGA